MPFLDWLRTQTHNTGVIGVFARHIIERLGNPSYPPPPSGHYSGWCSFLLGSADPVWDGYYAAAKEWELAYGSSLPDGSPRINEPTITPTGTIPK